MDLAKTELRGTSNPRKTINQELTMPRVSTDAPAKEINATIRRPDQSGAEELARLLGVAADVGGRIAGDIQDNHNKRDAATAMLDFGAGHKNDQQFAKSRAYRDAWQLEGTKKLSIDIGDSVTQKVNERLNDSDHPATLEDIDGIIESTFQSYVMGPDGKLKDFGTPEAKMTLARSLNEVRSNLLPQAQAAIKKQTDATYLTTWASNNVHEFYRGAPIGAPRPDPTVVTPDPQVTPTETRTVYYAGGSAPLAPFDGFHSKPTSGLGAPREAGSTHNGEDFAVPSGTLIQAPMQGEVIASFSNARGGNQVRVKLADGAIVGFAHLSSRSVKQGDTVALGSPLGLSGATGHATGPHVHMTVEVGGKKVSPTHYFASAKVPTGLPPGPPSVHTGTEPALATAAPGPPVALAPFDFEGAMSRVPPGIDKTEAKKFLIQSLINEANGKGDIGLLQGLEESKRKDGTPSLTPDEVASIQSAREVIGDRVRIKADQARKQLFDQNHDAVMQAFLSPNPPSIGWLRDQAHKGLIDPDFAYSMENHIDSEARAAQSEARSDAREARFEARQERASFVGSMVALRQSGDLSGADAKSDQQLFDSGKLGTGTEAISNLRTLRAAARSGESENLRNPEVSKYAGMLREEFGKAPTNILQKSLQGGGVNFFGMIGAYRSKVAQGKAPIDAYKEVIQQFAPTSKSAEQQRQDRIRELRAKRLGG